jgi:hypothetical protein
MVLEAIVRTCERGYLGKVTGTTSDLVRWVLREPKAPLAAKLLRRSHGVRPQRVRSCYAREAITANSTAAAKRRYAIAVIDPRSH